VARVSNQSNLRLFIMPRVKSKIVNGIRQNTPVEHRELTVADIKTIEKSVEKVDIKFLIDSAVTESDWIAAIRKMMDLAKDGDKRAFDLIAKYRFGLPPMMVQHGGEVQAGIAIVEVVRDGNRQSNFQQDDVIDGSVEEVSSDVPF
jgi:hypothetical protein